MVEKVRWLLLLSNLQQHIEIQQLFFYVIEDNMLLGKWHNDILPPMGPTANGKPTLLHLSVGERMGSSHCFKFAPGNKWRVDIASVLRRAGNGTTTFVEHNFFNVIKIMLSFNALKI